MSNYIYQVWDNIEHKSVGSFNSHNEAKKEVERLVRERDNFWEEFNFEIKKRKQNEMTRINKNDYNDLMVCI